MAVLHLQAGPESKKMLARALDKIYNHDIILSEQMLFESSSNLRDVEKIRRFVGKLITGKRF